MASSWLHPLVAQASTDPTSGLPLFPGATLVEKQPSGVACGITMHGAQYQSDATAAKAVAFFRKAVPNATTWTVPAAMVITEFLRPDGKAAVRVLGTPDGIYLVYASFSKPVSEALIRRGLRC